MGLVAFHTQFNLSLSLLLSRQKEIFNGPSVLQVKASCKLTQELRVMQESQTPCISRIPVPSRQTDHKVPIFHVCSRIPPTSSCKWRNYLFIHPAALHASLGSHSSAQQNVKYLSCSNSLSGAFHLLSFCLFVWLQALGIRARSSPFPSGSQCRGSSLFHSCSASPFSDVKGKGGGWRRRLFTVALLSQGAISLSSPLFHIP